MVVAIIGIAGAVVVPQMLSAGSLQVQGAGRMVIADIIYAQNEAIAQQANRRIVFDSAQNRYRLTDAAGNTLPASWRTGKSDTSNYVVDLAADGRFAQVGLSSVDFNKTSTLEFDPLGAPLNGGTVDIVGGGLRYRITVQPITGRVTIAPVTAGG